MPDDDPTQATRLERDRLQALYQDAADAPAAAGREREQRERATLPWWRKVFG